MSVMRTTITALILITAAVSQASFDLMLLPDQSSGRIVRFDPINQIQLGSVNVQTLARSVVANNSSAPFAYSSGNTGGIKFNYSTGERITSASFPNGALSLNHDGSRVYETIGADTVYRYNANLGFLGNFSSLSMVNTMAVQQYTNDRVVLIGLNSAGDLIAANHDTIAHAQVGSTVMLVSAANLLAGSTVQGMELTTFNRGVLTYRASDNSTRLMYVAMDAFGGVTGPLSSTTVAGYATATTASTMVLRGHAGFFVVGTNAAGTGTYITEYAIPFSSATGVYTLNGVTMPTTGRWRATNIVAPEPGTMVALGAGLVVLLRRRRKA